MRRPLIHWHEGGGGPALLLINGWSCSGLVWPRALVRRLEQRFHVIRPDNRGAGWSRSAPVPFLIEDLADDVAAVLAAAGAGSATVVGLSLGGMIAQELALRHPERVRQLIVVASRPPAPDHVNGDPVAIARMFMAPAPGEPLERFFRRQWSYFMSDEYLAAHPDALDEIAAALAERPMPRALLRAQLRAIAAWHGARRLRTLTTPTVVVHGDRDPLSPVRNGMRLAQLIPEAEYVELVGVGHVVPWEAGDRLAELVEQPQRAHAAA